MGQLLDVVIGAQPLERFHSIVAAEALASALQAATRVRERLAGRVVWNVNSTAVGGGVAEMLGPLISYARGAGVDARWLVIDGSPEFFQVTKRLHHALHGSTGDGSPLGEVERRVYEQTLHANATELAARVRPADIVVLHDPQTAGLAPALVSLGARVIWRCHIGHDKSDDEVERGWQFLAPYLNPVRWFVFSREQYVPEVCDHGKASIIPPSIDAFSPKNQELSGDAVRTILVHAGLIEGPLPASADRSFLRRDGTPGRVERRADVIRMGRTTPWDTPLVVQVSRWDTLKDPVGVLRGFTLLVDGAASGAELLLAGPNVHAVADDPEAAAVFQQVLSEWRALPHSLRDRITLASLPTADVQENAAIVNALQRHASVIVQKSLREGFGLTVTEGMWKRRPVLGSAVGGIQDQIEDGVNGVLLRDPSDLRAFAAALRGLLHDPERSRRLGEAAQETVRERYLGLRHLLDYTRLIERVDAA